MARTQATLVGSFVLALACFGVAAQSSASSQFMPLLEGRTVQQVHRYYVERYGFAEKTEITLTGHKLLCIATDVGSGTYIPYGVIYFVKKDGCHLAAVVNTGRPSISLAFSRKQQSRAQVIRVRALSLQGKRQRLKLASLSLKSLLLGEQKYSKVKARHLDSHHR